MRPVCILSVQEDDGEALQLSCQDDLATAVGQAVLGLMTLDFVSPTERGDRKHAAHAALRPALDETRILPLHLVLRADEPEIGRRPE